MKQFSRETRERMSESAKRRCADPEWIAKQHDRGTKLPYSVVKSLYEGGMTQKEIALALGTSQKVVWRFMKNNCIKSRTPTKRDQWGEKNSSWVGGVVKNDSGYVLVKKDNHPRAKKSGGYVLEHILVAESVIGRPLYENEVVHHINGIKDDNRPENLSVMTRSDHVRYHSLLRYGSSPETPKPILQKGDL